MTVIKQVSVSSPKHMTNLARYLNDDRVLARSSQNLFNEKNWEKEFEETRRAYGHDVPSRAGAANTVAFHQVIAFNPDECSVSGGPMSPERCMEFAGEWVRNRYPNQKAVWVLHREKCRADGTERFAVHVAINRTDLSTGRRLNEGRSKNAKIARANAMRDMDRKWQLRQVKANERNSRVHARQPTRAEKEMAKRGMRSDKQYIREAVKASVREVRQHPQKNNVRALAQALDGKGIAMTVSKSGDDFTFERERSGLKVNGVKLGRGFSQAGLAHALGMEAVRQVERGAEEEMSRG